MVAEEGAREAGPEDVVADAVVQVAAAAGDVVELDGVGDVIEGQARHPPAAVAGEDDEDDVQVIARDAGDELLVLVDGAAGVARHVDDREVVVAGEGEFVDLRLVRVPKAGLGRDVGALRLGPDVRRARIFI